MCTQLYVRKFSVLTMYDMSMQACTCRMNICKFNSREGNCHYVVQLEQLNSEHLLLQVGAHQDGTHVLLYAIADKGWNLKSNFARIREGLSSCNLSRCRGMEHNTMFILLCSLCRN